MKCHIFIRSHAKDFPWLAYALRSIAKFTTGFSGVTVVIPDRDLEEYRQMLLRNPVITAKIMCACGGNPISIHCAPEGPKGMLESQLKVCKCDRIVPFDTTHVLFTDSDCMFINPTCPQDYTIGGKPIMIGAPFANMAPGTGQLNWQIAARACLGFQPEYEFMTRHPCMYPVWLFPKLRAHIAEYTRCGFDEYVLSCRNEWPQTFAEFTTIGAFAHMFHWEHFHFIEEKLENAAAQDMKGPEMADSGNPAKMKHVQAYWSHEGVKSHVEEFERLLA